METKLYVVDKIMQVLACIVMLISCGIMIFCIIFFATELLNAISFLGAVSDSMMLVACSLTGYLCIQILINMIRYVVRR